MDTLKYKLLSYIHHSDSYFAKKIRNYLPISWKDILCDYLTEKKKIHATGNKIRIVEKTNLLKDHCLNSLTGHKLLRALI